jgi:endogenous inhibitor of DNA gyrase (YacG/DUF329 family)
MSFEGYYQALCENGHLSIYDAYELIERKCPYCNKSTVWTNLIDETNGCDYTDCELPEKEKQICRLHGCGWVELEIVEEAKIETCPTCGHTKTLEPARYKIPEKAY